MLPTISILQLRRNIPWTTMTLIVEKDKLFEILQWTLGAWLLSIWGRMILKKKCKYNCVKQAQLVPRGIVLPELSHPNRCQCALQVAQSLWKMGLKFFWLENLQDKLVSTGTTTTTTTTAAICLTQTIICRVRLGEAVSFLVCGVWILLGRKWMLPSLLASGAVVLEVSHHISWTTRSPEVSIVQSHQEFRFLPGLLSCLFRLRKSWSTPQLHFASTCKLQKSCFVVSSCASWHRSSQPRSLPPVFLAWWRALGDPIWKRIALVLSVDLWQCHSLHHCLKHCQTPSAAGSSLFGVRGKNRQQCLPLNLPPRHRRIRTVSGSDHFVPRHNSWILRNSNLSQLRALLAGRQRTFQRQIQHGC